MCDVCGVTDRGTKKLLAEKGWRRAIAYPLGVKKVVMRCSAHIEGYDDLISRYMKRGVRLSTHIGPLMLKGKVEDVGDIRLTEPKHFTGVEEDVETRKPNRIERGA